MGIDEKISSNKIQEKKDSQESVPPYAEIFKALHTDVYGIVSGVNKTYRMLRGDFETLSDEAKNMLSSLGMVDETQIDSEHKVIKVKITPGYLAKYYGEAR